MKSRWSWLALPWLTLAVWAALLVLWFGGAGGPSGAEPRALRVWPLAVLLAILLVVLAAATAWVYRRRVAALAAELSAAFPCDRTAVLVVAVVLAISFAFQLPTMLYPSGLVHSDAAINGLMALHIEAGRAAPAFYYGQQFMGTLFSHALALVFFLVGPFSGGLALLTWLFYAGFLLATFLMVRQATTATVAAATAFWLAVPPTTLIIVLAQSEYPQLLLLAGWGLLLTAGRSGGALRDDAWWWFAGAAFGLAFWAHALAVLPLAAVLGGLFLLLPLRAVAGATARIAAGFTIGVLPGLVGWGAGLGRFVEWFLAGGGRGGDATFIEAASGLASVSLGNLLFDTAGRRVLPWATAGPLAAAVLAAACWGVLAGFAYRVRRNAEWRGRRAERDQRPLRGAKRRGREETAEPVRELQRLAVVVPLGLFVLLQLGLLALRHPYAVTPTHYLVPLYLALPALVAIAAVAAVERGVALVTGRPASATRLQSRAGRGDGTLAVTGGRGAHLGTVVVAGLIALWAYIPLPGSIAWLRGLAGNQATFDASIAALRDAGVETCEGPYWDAYRLSYLSLETIVCESIDVRRVPHYPELVRQRAGGAPVPFIAAPQRAEALAGRAEQWEARGIGYRRLQTPRFIALLPER